MYLSLDCTQTAADDATGSQPAGARNGPTVGGNGITTVTATPVPSPGPGSGRTGGGRRPAGDPGGPAARQYPRGPPRRTPRPRSPRSSAVYYSGMPLADGRPSPATPSCGDSGFRRHGRGLPGPASPTAAPGRAEGPARRGVRRRGIPRAVQPGGRHRGHAVAPAHRRRARPRRVRRPAVDLDGLRRRHRRRPPARRALPGRNARRQGRRIVTAVADALDYAHQRDLLHRDVKPANILLANPDSEDQRILLADFGIARWVDDAERSDRRRT